MKSLQHTAIEKIERTPVLNPNTTLHHDWLFSVGDLPVARGQQAHPPSLVLQQCFHLDRPAVLSQGTSEWQLKHKKRQFKNTDNGSLYTVSGVLDSVL